MPQSPPLQGGEKNRNPSAARRATLSGVCIIILPAMSNIQGEQLTRRRAQPLRKARNLNRMNRELDLTIRRAELADLTAIHRIDHLCFPALLAYDMDMFIYCLRDHLSEAWVADSADGVIGFAIFQMESRRHSHFITLDVLPEHRGKRIGSMLMDHAHDRARARGASVMVLQVAVVNQVAMDFYERRGYVKTRLIKRYYEDKTDAWEMKLDLGKP